MRSNRCHSYLFRCPVLVSASHAVLWLKCDQMSVWKQDNQYRGSSVGGVGILLTVGSPLPYNSPLFCKLKSHKDLSIECFFLSLLQPLIASSGSFSRSLRTCCVFNEWNLPLACHSQSYAVLVVGDFWRDFSQMGGIFGHCTTFPVRSYVHYQKHPLAPFIHVRLA